MTVSPTAPRAIRCGTLQAEVALTEPVVSPTTLITADDLLALPDNGEKYELVRGELRVMAPAGFEHGRVGLRFGARLLMFVEAHGLGVVVGPDTGFLLSKNPDVIRSPDVGFVTSARVPTQPTQKFFPGAPDLAVEFLSPSDTAMEIEERLADYFSAGTQLVWVINPRTRTASVYRPNQPVLRLIANDALTAPDLLPGFECKVGDLFT